MVKFLPVENPDKPVPKQVYNYTIVFLACCASFASLLIGYDSAFLGGTIALPAFKHAFGNLDPNTSGNLVITYQAGAVVGAMLAYPMGFYWGRRWALISCAMTFLIAAIVMVIASPSTGLAPIYAGRTVAGLAIGAASNLTPLYIGEIAPTSIRGMLVGIFELGWQVGAIIGFFINYAVSIHYSNTSKEQWLIPFAVQLIPGGLFALTAPFLIESPRWLLSKDRNDEAIARLTRIRKLPADHEYIVDEVAMMTTALEAERADIGTSFWAPWRRIFSRQMIFRPFLSFMCFFFQNASSINAINYYSPTILKSFGIDSLKIGLLGTGVFGILKGVAAVVWLLFLVDQWGRRKIFIAGCAGCSVFLWWIALYLNIAPAASYTRKSGDSVSPGSMATLVAFYLWTISYGATLNGTPWVLSSEMYPQSVRGAGMVVAAVSNWSINVAVSRITPVAFATIGVRYWFVFASLCTTGVFFFFFLLPETKQVPIEYMDELFHSKEKAWNAGKVIRAKVVHDQMVNDQAMVQRSDTESDIDRKDGSIA